MDALRTLLVTLSSTGVDDPRRVQAGLTFVPAAASTVDVASDTVASRWRRARSSRQPAMPRTIALGLFAASLALTAAAPALTKGPDRGPHGSNQRQEQGVTAEKKGGKGGKGGKNGSKAKTVRKTFSNGGSIAIPAVGSVDDFGPAEPYPSTIQVSGFKQAKITDVNVTLRGFSHEFSQDVDVLLVAPGGRNAIVMGDVGGVDQFSQVTDLTITLDDEAAASPSIADDQELVSGSFQPFDRFGPVDFEEPFEGILLDFPAPAPSPSGANALSTFDGINPNGQWQLFVIDDVEGDIGSLDGGWSLQITAKSKKQHNKRRQRAWASRA